MLSGPSGAGKNSLMERLRRLEPHIHYCVTATTRRPRRGERAGVDYFFLSDEEFEGLIASGGMLEWARVHGRLYGVPCAPVREALERRQDVLACVDVQGAMTIRSRVPSAILVFLAPWDLEDLRTRLQQRGTESDLELKQRLVTAERELRQIPAFDYLVYNQEGQLDEAVERVRAIIWSERGRVQPRYAVLEGVCGQ